MTLSVPGKMFIFWRLPHLEWIFKGFSFSHQRAMCKAGWCRSLWTLALWIIKCLHGLTSLERTKWGDSVEMVLACAFCSLQGQDFENECIISWMKLLGFHKWNLRTKIFINIFKCLSNIFQKYFQLYLKILLINIIFIKYILNESIYS